MSKTNDVYFMRLALGLARRGYGATSPNPMVGAVLAKGGRIIGRGWHRRAGWAHAEIEALGDTQKRGQSPKGATLYVTLEPCSTHGRTPPCTEAIIAAGIRRVVIGATDPNPRHGGRAFKILRRAGVEVVHGVLAEECAGLNGAFNHWIVEGTPLVTVKAAMTLDGKIAAADGESKWITGAEARAVGMELRQGADAVLVGVNTVLADDPSLTFRADEGTSMHYPPHPGPLPSTLRSAVAEDGLGEGECGGTRLRRIVLDAMARTPLRAKVASDAFAELTTIVVSRDAPKKRVAALAKRVEVVVGPLLSASYEGGQDSHANDSPSPTNEQHKKRRSLCSLEALPAGRGRMARRWLETSGNWIGSGVQGANRSKVKTGKRPVLLDLRWLMKRLGAEGVTSVLVEGGGETNASFLLGGLAQRVAFFYAPKILGGRDGRKAVGGEGVRALSEAIELEEVEWKKIGDDLMMTAKIS